MWEIHTFGNGDVIAGLLSGLTLMMTSTTMMSILVVCGLLMMLFILGNPFGESRKALTAFAGLVVIVYLTTVITQTVLVVDEVNPEIGNQPVQNVPLILAAPAFISGFIGWQITSLTESVFTVATGTGGPPLAFPNVYRSSRTGPNRAMFDFQKILDAQLTGSSIARIANYIHQCVFVDIDAGRLNQNTLLNSTDLLAAMASTNDADMIEGLTCRDFYTNVVLVLMAPGDPDYDRSIKSLETNLNITPLSAFTAPVLGDQISANLLPSIQTGTQMINNAMLTKAWQNASSQELDKYEGFTGSKAEQTAALSQSLKSQSYGVSNIVQKLIPMLRTLAEGMVYGLAPFVLVFAVSPAMGAFMGLYLKMFFWLQAWGPLYAVINYIVFSEAHSRMVSLSTGVGAFNGVTINSYPILTDLTGMLNSAAGDLIWMVPAVAWALVWGGSSIGGALSSAGRTAQGTSEQISSAFARGEGKVLMEGSPARFEWAVNKGEVADAGHTMNHRSWQAVQGSEGIGMIDQMGGMTIRGRDGVTSSYSPKGFYEINTPDGTATYDAKTGFMTAGVRRQDFARDPMTGEMGPTQVEAIGGGFTKSTMQLSRSEGLTELVRISGPDGRETRRSEVAIRNGLKFSSEAGPNGRGTTSVAGMEHVGLYGQNSDGSRVLLGTRLMEVSGTASGMMNGAPEGLSFDRATAMVDHESGISASGRLFKGASGQWEMDVSHGSQDTLLKFFGFGQAGTHSLGPVQGAVSPRGLDQPAQVTATSGRVQSLPIYGADGQQLSVVTGSLSGGGLSSFTLGDPVHALDMNSTAFTFEGQNESHETVRASGYFNSLNQFVATEYGSRQGDHGDFSGEITLPDGSKFKGAYETVGQGDKQVLSLKKGAITLDDGSTQSVLSGVYTAQEGRVELNTNSGPRSVQTLSDGTTITRSGDTKNGVVTTRYTGGGIHVQPFIHDGKTGELRYLAGPSVPSSGILTTTKTMKEGSADSVTATFEADKNHGAFRLSGTGSIAHDGKQMTAASFDATNGTVGHSIQLTETSSRGTKSADLIPGNFHEMASRENMSLTTPNGIYTGSYEVSHVNGEQYLLKGGTLKVGAGDNAHIYSVESGAILDDGVIALKTKSGEESMRIYPNGTTIAREGTADDGKITVGFSGSGKLPEYMVDPHTGEVSEKPNGKKSLHPMDLKASYNMTNGKAELTTGEFSFVDPKTHQTVKGNAGVTWSGKSPGEGLPTLSITSGSIVSGVQKDIAAGGKRTQETLNPVQGDSVESRVGSGRTVVGPSSRRINGQNMFGWETSQYSNDGKRLSSVFTNSDSSKGVGELTLENGEKVAFRYSQDNIVGTDVGLTDIDAMKKDRRPGWVTTPDGSKAFVVFDAEFYQNADAQRMNPDALGQLIVSRASRGEKISMFVPQTIMGQTAMMDVTMMKDPDSDQMVYQANGINEIKMAFGGREALMSVGPDKSTLKFRASGGTETVDVNRYMVYNDSQARWTITQGFLDMVGVDKTNPSASTKAFMLSIAGLERGYDAGMRALQGYNSLRNAQRGNKPGSGSTGGGSKGPGPSGSSGPLLPPAAGSKYAPPGAKFDSSDTNEFKIAYQEAGRLEAELRKQGLHESEIEKRIFEFMGVKGQGSLGGGN